MLKAKLKNLETGEYFPFQYNPEETEDNPGQANYAVVPVPGLGDPLLQFASGAARVIRFTLLLNDFGENERPLFSVEEAIALLQSWKEPVAQSTAVFQMGYAPPLLLLVWPGMGAVTCVLVNCPARRVKFRPGTLHAIRAFVDVELWKYVESPI